MLALHRLRSASGSHNRLCVLCLIVFLHTILLSPAQQFEEVPTSLPGVFNPAFSWADYDLDGDYDLLVGGNSAANASLLTIVKNANNTFVEDISFPVEGTPNSAWADFDGDGDMEFAPGGHSIQLSGTRTYSLCGNNDGHFQEMRGTIDSTGVPFWADFDRDGDLDLAICGRSLAPLDPPGTLWRIYLNHPTRPWLLGRSISLHYSARDPVVADWNGDGWPDLLHLYRDNLDQWILQVHLNGPELTFSSLELPLGSTDTPYHGSWGDYDNDGDLDFAFNGERGATRVTKFVYNKGGSLASFLVDETACIGLAWTDFDSDGLLDLTITGAGTDGFHPLLRHYRNLGSQIEPFFGAGIDIPHVGAGLSAISTTDIDNDGDQDMIVAGETNGIPSTRVFRNLLNISNTPPVAPAGLTGNLNANGAVTLSWLGSSDVNQAGGLTYNVWVRRTDSSLFLVPPGARLETGRLNTLQRGNAGSTNFFILTNLVAGTYEWSVQAVDNSFASSPFAGTSQFTIPAGSPRFEFFEIGTPFFLPHTRFGIDAETQLLANGAETALWFEYSTNASFLLRSEPLFISNSPLVQLSSVWITNLLVNQQYFIRAVASNSVGTTYSVTNAFFTTNQIPSIAAPFVMDGLPGRTSGPITISVSDRETPAELLELRVELLDHPTLNPELISLEDIDVETNGAQRIVRIYSPEDQFGMAILRFTVVDEHGASRAVGMSYYANVFVRSGTLPSILSANVPVDVDSDGLMDLLNSLRWLRNVSGTNFANAGSVVANFTATTDLALDDIDNDGRVDVAFATLVANAPQVKLFTNSTQIPHGFRAIPQDLFPDFLNGVLSFADFDLDGDADLFASGLTNRSGTEGHARVVWRNDGNKNFTPLPEVFPRLHQAGLAWTDYNYDGAPDVVLIGMHRGTGAGYTELLLNDGLGNLVASGIPFPQYVAGTPFWGDFDSDGRADLLITGRTGRTNGIAIYQNAPDGTFIEKFLVEPFMVRKSILGDFDADGSLDILCEGFDDFFLASETKIYLNRGGWTFEEASAVRDRTATAFPSPLSLADFDRDGRLEIATPTAIFEANTDRTNTPPSAPLNLVAIHESNGVLLSWSNAQDLNQTNGLTYNVRVGRTPAGSEVISPLSRHDGVRLVTQPGNVNHSFRRIVRNLAPGTYYWSIQAIDNSFAGGPFAAEQSFTILPSNPRIISVKSEGANLLLSMEAAGGGALVIEMSFDLKEWLPIQTNTPPFGTITVQGPLNDSEAFYRALLLH